MSPNIFLDRDQVTVRSQQYNAHASLFEEGPAFLAAVITGSIKAVYDPVHLIWIVLADALMQVAHEDDEHLGVGVGLSAGVVDSTFRVYCSD